MGGAKCEGEVCIHGSSVCPWAEQLDVGSGVAGGCDLTPVDADVQLPGFEPLRVADFQFQVNWFLAAEYQAGLLLLGKAGFLAYDQALFPTVEFGRDKLVDKKGILEMVIDILLLLAVFLHPPLDAAGEFSGVLTGFSSVLFVGESWG